MGLATAFGEVALQASLLLLTSRGWGEVLAALRVIPSSHGRFTHALRTLLGLCGFTLFLITTTYATIPLKYSAWVVLAVALVGLWVGMVSWKKTTPASPRQAREERYGFSVLALVFLLQGIPLFWIGPGNYEAFGHIDLYDYINIAQFLIEKPITLDRTAGLSEPWLQTALNLRDQRIGQVLPISYLSAILQIDTDRTYGTVSILYLALLSLAVFICLRQLQIPLAFAWSFSLWAGLTHGITYSSSTSFLSNSSILFVLPLLATLLWRHRYHLPDLQLTSGLLLAYAFISYTELFPWIAMAFLAMWLSLANWHSRLDWRSLEVTLLAFLVLVILYVPYAVRAELDIYRSAIKTTADWHELMSNDSGTWKGWRQVFFATISSRSLPWMNGLALGFAVSFLALIPWALSIHRSAKSRYLSVIAIVIAFWPLLLLALPVFKPYPFFKIVMTFLPLFFVLLAYAWTRLARSVNTWEPALRLALSGLILLSVISSAFFWKSLIQLSGTQSGNTPAMGVIYEAVRQHPEKTYYLTDANELRAGWIAYKARHSQVRLAPQTRLVWGFPADPQAKPPAPPYVVLDGEHLPYEVR